MESSFPTFSRKLPLYGLTPSKLLQENLDLPFHDFSKILTPPHIKKGTVSLTVPSTVT